MNESSKYIGLIFILVTIQCSRTTKDSPTTESTDSSKAVIDTVTKADYPSVRKKVVLIIKDSTQYSRRFLSGLRAIGPGTKFELRDDTIITDDSYRSNFAQLLPRNKEIIFRGQRNGRKYELKVNRVNYSTISYDFSFMDEKGEIIKDAGEADKSPQFMLGSEMDEDDNGFGYFCSEYSTVNPKYLYSVRIGLLKDKTLVAKVSGVGDKLSLENCPTLR